MRDVSNRPALDVLEERHESNRKHAGELPAPRSSFLVTPPARIGELGMVVEIKRTEKDHG